MQNNPVNLIDPYGLKGGVLIPLRNYIKNNIGAGDILGPILDQIVSIPYTPPAAFFYIMGPKDVGEGSSRYTFEPQDYDVIPMDWSPYNPKYWDVPEDGVVLKQGPCE